VPLLVALHGKGDRAERFEREALEALPAGWALLVPSAPIPRDRNVAAHRGAGDAWYLYDGDTDLFRESLGRAEAHLVGLLARVLAEDPPPGFRGPDPGRVALLGFSQGGYLAGITAVRHPGLFRAVVVAGGRLKHEMLGGEFPAARAAGLSLLGVHGGEDRSVPPEPSRRSLEAARAAGLDASFRVLPGAHVFTPAMGAVVRAWLPRKVRRRR